MRISEDAVNRVLAAADELDYRPNMVARSLRTNLSHTIGFLSDRTTTEGLTGELIRGGLDMAQKQGRLLFIGETQADVDLELDLVHSMLDWRVAGFVYATMFTRETGLPAPLEHHPVVLLNCTSAGSQAPVVLPDELGAGSTAAQALLEAGHRDDIVFVGGTRQVLANGVIAARERLAGLEAGLDEAGTRLADFIACAWQPESSYEAVSAFFAEGGGASAMVCMNDRAAFGTYQAIADAGLRIPDDISVVSFDDSDLAGWLRPGLTSIAIPHFTMGRLAVELVLAESRPPEVHRLPMPLHRRGSIGAPSRTLR